MFSGFPNKSVTPNLTNNPHLYTDFSTSGNVFSKFRWKAVSLRSLSCANYMQSKCKVRKFKYSIMSVGQCHKWKSWSLWKKQYPLQLEAEKGALQDAKRLMEGTIRTGSCRQSLRAEPPRENSPKPQRLALLLLLDQRATVMWISLLEETQWGSFCHLQLDPQQPSDASCPSSPTNLCFQTRWLTSINRER